ncbi:MAG: hypothetical protein V4713_03935 [Pseudomonadota bacterium]
MFELMRKLRVFSYLILLIICAGCGKEQGMVVEPINVSVTPEGRATVISKLTDRQGKQYRCVHKMNVKPAQDKDARAGVEITIPAGAAFGCDPI